MFFSLALNKLKETELVMSSLSLFQYLGALTKNEPLQILSLKLWLGRIWEDLLRRE